MYFTHGNVFVSMPLSQFGDSLLPALCPQIWFLCLCLHSVQFLTHVWLFATLWTAALQASQSITNCWSLPKPMSIELVIQCNHLISSVVPFSSCPQSYPASGSFQISPHCTSCGQRFGISASTPVLPKNTEDWSPLGWTCWISLQSKGLSRVFSNTTVQDHQFYCTQLSL